MKTKIHLHFEFICAAILLVIAAALRIYGIERESLWTDELFAVLLSYKDHFCDIIPTLVHDSHPPGYAAFMYFSIPVLGTDDWQIRLHSVASGIALVYVTFLTGKRYLSTAAGLLAALLVTFSYEAIYYSQEARAYSMLAMACMFNLYFFLALFIEQQFHIKNYSWFIFTGICCVYLHYSGVVFFASEALLCMVLMVSAKHRSLLLKPAAIAFLPVVAAFSPWMHAMYQHMTGISDYWGGDKKLGWREYQDLKEFIAGPSTIFADILLYTVAASGGVAIIKAVISLFRKSPTENTRFFLVILLMLLLPISVFYFKSLLSQTVFQNRHFIYAIPLAALVAAYSFGELLKLIKPSYLSWGFVLLLAGFIGWYQFMLNQEKGLYTYDRKDRIRDAVNIVKNDHGFKAGNNGLVYSSHGSFNHYLIQRHILTDIPYDLYTSQHYLEIKKLIGDPRYNSLYYINIGSVENYGFYGELSKHHALICQSVLSSLSGIIIVSKFDLKKNAVTNLSVPDCQN